MLEDQSKIHETQEDKNRQEAILKQYEEGRNDRNDPTDRRFRVRTSPDLSRYDGEVHVGNHLSRILEVKHRNIPMDKYDTYTIDKDKLDSLYQLAHEKKVSASLVVSWQGVIRELNISFTLRDSMTREPIMDDWCEPPEERFPTKTQKRRDRDELADVVYCIPIKEFHLIGLK